MPKAKTFKSSHDENIVVAVPGQSPITFEPGESVQVDDAAVIAALSANPDLEVVKGSKK